jgi:triosephosphate isomerase
MDKKLVIANWKLHFSVPESTVKIEKLKKDFAKIKRVEIVICPSFIDIYPASKELQKTNIVLGAQNLFYKDEGAYTGEVSAVALEHFIKYVLIGHSERRLLFNETDKQISQKAEVAVAHDITPVICVGETLHDKEDGLSKVVVMNQVETCLSHLTASEVAESVIAYEPVWAIGTGHVCKIEDAEAMAMNIRNLVKALYGEKPSRSLRVIYGGSVDDKNVKTFSKSNKIDGVLVGSASLDPKEYASIVKVFDNGNKVKK